MAPTPLAVTLTATIHPPLENGQALRVGRGLAERLNGDLLATTGRDGDPTWTWTLGVPHDDDNGDDIGHYAETAEHRLHAALGLAPGARLQSVDAIELARVTELTRRAGLRSSTRPALVGVEEACEILGIQRSRFYVLSQREEFPHEVHRHVWLKAEMQQYAAARSPAPEPATDADRAALALDGFGRGWADRLPTAAAGEGPLAGARVVFDRGEKAGGMVALADGTTLYLRRGPAMRWLATPRPDLVASDAGR